MAFGTIRKSSVASKAATKAANPFAINLVKSLKKEGLGSAKNVSLMADDEVLSDVTEFIPSGFAGLDRILGGGWAVGRASEVYGDEGSGKSALSHIFIVSAQAMGCIVMYIDFEAALDPPKMKQLGIDPDRLIYCTPDYIEQAWDLIWAALDRVEKENPGVPMVIIWDSIAAAIPKKEFMEETAESEAVGVIARAMSKGCRKMYRRIAQVRAHMMWINQERAKIGGFASFGPPPADTCGGRAVRYACSQRCKVQKVMTLKTGIRATGYLVKVSTKKNRCAPPHQSTTWVLDFKVGPSPLLTAFQHLRERAIIKPSGQKDGAVIAPWSKLSFTPDDWPRLIAEHPEFAAGAQAAYTTLLEKMATETTAPGKAGESSGED